MIDLTPERLAALKSAALAATGGEWRACGAGYEPPSVFGTMLAIRRELMAPGESCSCRTVWSLDADVPIIKAIEIADADAGEEIGVDASQARANARYVALASPAVVLGLLERIERLERIARSGTTDGFRRVVRHLREG